MSVELKPCPHCGSENLKLIKSPVYDANYRLTRDMYYFYQCQYCGAQGGGGYTETKAAEKWNARTRPTNGEKSD